MKNKDQTIFMMGKIKENHIHLKRVLGAPVHANNSVTAAPISVHEFVRALLQPSFDKDILSRGKGNGLPYDCTTPLISLVLMVSPFLSFSISFKTAFVTFRKDKGKRPVDYRLQHVCYLDSEYITQ